jgi:hypothetical protein
MNIPQRLAFATILLLASWNPDVSGQVECTGTGSLRGIRVEGELMAFSTSIRAITSTSAEIAGGRGRGGGGGGGQFSRDGNTLTITGSLTGGRGGFGGGFGFGRGRGGAPAAGVS